MPPRPAARRMRALIRIVSPRGGRAASAALSLLTAGAVTTGLLAAVVAGPAAADAAVPAAPAAGTALVGPVPIRVLPAALDVASPYLPQTSCDPAVRPGAAALRSLMLNTYRRGHDGGVVRACSVGGTSEHKEGRAWDWMLDVAKPADRAAATQVLAWLTAPDPTTGQLGANARRLGIMYMIWDGKIWASYRSAEGWRPYTGASEHTDHIHFSLSWDGAFRRTSWWDGTVVLRSDLGPCRTVVGQPAPAYTAARFTACPTPAPAPQATPTPSGATVAAPAGSPGAGAPPASVPATAAPSPAVTPPAAKPPTTPPAAKPPTTPPAAKPAGTPLVAKPAPAPSRRPVLRPGMRGTWVRTLQIALKLPAKYRTGLFGPVTRNAVLRIQKAHHLPATGVVDARTWSVLPAR